jgi:hypothetical protein
MVILTDTEKSYYIKMGKHRIMSDLKECALRLHRDFGWDLEVILVRASGIGLKMEMPSTI